MITLLLQHKDCIFCAVDYAFKYESSRCKCNVIITALQHMNLCNFLTSLLLALSNDGQLCQYVCSDILALN